MFRYANYQICIFMNINEKIRNKRKSLKNKGVYMQINLHLSCLLSYTTSLGTNLMLIHSMCLLSYTTSLGTNLMLIHSMCLLSYTTSLGTNLMLIHSMFT